MKFQIGQQAKTGQQMKLAPRIIQTMEIMQLPLPALEEKIAQELESNFALELVEPDSLKQKTSIPKKKSILNSVALKSLNNEVAQSFLICPQGK